MLDGVVMWRSMLGGEVCECTEPCSMLSVFFFLAEKSAQEIDEGLGRAEMYIRESTHTHTHTHTHTTHTHTHTHTHITYTHNTPPTRPPVGRSGGARQQKKKKRRQKHRPARALDNNPTRRDE